jgi:hypothetical protein
MTLADALAACAVKEKTATAQSAIAHLVCDLICMARTMPNLKTLFKARRVTPLLPSLPGEVACP